MRDTYILLIPFRDFLVNKDLGDHLEMLEILTLD